MLYLYCGDHTVASRDALSLVKSKFRAEGKAIVSLDPSAVDDMVKSGGSDARDLFSGAPVYETSGLVSVYKKKYARKAKERLRSLAVDSTIELLDWEEKSAYDLGLDKEKGGWIYESKPTQSTFTLLPCLIPGKKNEFLTVLASLSHHQAIEITLAMIHRHVRLMVALSAGTSPKDSPFLVRLARSTLRCWSIDTLTRFYYHLLRIDVHSKTGQGSPLPPRKQLEILVCVML